MYNAEGPAREGGDAALLKFLQHRRRLVGGQENHVRTQIDRKDQRVAKAPDMEQRRHVEDVLGIERQRPERDDAVAEGHQILVPVLGAFRQSGGAAGKEQRAEVVGFRQGERRGGL
jgi:hypothetical protein